MKKWVLGILIMSSLACADFSYECTVYFYIGPDMHTSFRLSEYDSRYAERILMQKLKNEGKDPKKAHCIVY